MEELSAHSEVWWEQRGAVGGERESRGSGQVAEATLSVLGVSVTVRTVPLVRLWAVVEDFNQGSGMMRFVFKRSSSGSGERPAQEEG